MNLCAKINSKAPASVMVIGRDLYLVLLLLHLPRSYKVIIDSLPVFWYYSVTSKYSGSYPGPDTILSALNGNGAHKICILLIHSADLLIKVP